MSGPLLKPVAFLGVGLMGAPMARRLVAAGHEVHVWNRSPEKTVALQSIGATVHAQVVDAVRQVSLIFMCLTDASAVEEVLFGDEGIAQTLLAGSLVVDFSTIGPQHTRRLALRLQQETGACWLDSPVSGGVSGAENGTLAMFVGGNKEDYAVCLPFLKLLGRTITYMGETGAGQSTKLCNQLIVTANLLAIAEAIRLGEALGVNVTALPAALSGGFADSRPLQIYGPRMAAPVDDVAHIGSVRTMFKDIGEICDEASNVGLPIPLMATVKGMYRQLIDNGHGNKDLTALMQLYPNTRRE